jgi:Leucine-rich repeat (LRR) protein
MLGVLVFGGPCGMYIASARRQAQTVAAIQRLGGSVVYVPREQDEARGVDEQPPPLAAWLIQNLGQDVVESVTMAFLRYPSASEPARDEEEWARINDDLATRLGELSHLESLTIKKIPHFTDNHLAHLAGLNRMRWLTLSDTSLDGESLRHLKGMKQLESLDLLGIPIRDRDLANLAGLTNLKSLSISGNLVTDEGLQHLSSLKRLTMLNIRNTGRSPMAITSRGLSHLAGSSQMEALYVESSRIESLEPLRSMNRLKNIYLIGASLADQGLAALHLGFENLSGLVLPGNPAITDAGLIHFSGLKNLRRLDLSRASITGSGLAHLASLTQLGGLQLGSTKISDQGLAQLDPGSKIFTYNTFIELQDTSISEVGLSQLLKASSPRALFVFGTKTTPGGLAELQNQYGTTKLIPQYMRIR